ncbi:MAG TPA: hypothetical protein PKA13_04330 [Geminicoccaceae bacterium]|nr:hypothetical protein [Geminicoccus sp.]HMU48976.1 hypothetical protein [Geminicoccaceae bacterium]
MSEIPREKSGKLAHALAAGKPAAEAAAALGLSLEDVAAAMDDPIFIDLVAGWRAYLAAPEGERLEELCAIAHVVLRGEAARGNPTVLAFLASRDEEEAERGGMLH